MYFYYLLSRAIDSLLLSFNQLEFWEKAIVLNRNTNWIHSTGKIFFWNNVVLSEIEK